MCTFNCIDGTNIHYTSPMGIKYKEKPCDDGNEVNNDGCSTLCEIDEGWTCHGGTATNPDTCTCICGDGH